MEGLGAGVDAGGRLPAKVEAEPVDSLARRDRPSKACRSITVAITRAGMVGRPLAELLVEIGEVVEVWPRASPRLSTRVRSST